MFKTTLSALALAGCSFGAQAAWNATGDTLDSAGTLTLTSAFVGAGDPDAPFNVSGTPAAEIGLLEAALGLPAYALDLSDDEYGTEGSVAWQSFAVGAGSTLSFSWDFSTHENNFEDRAFVVVDGSIFTLATRTQGSATGAFSQIFADAGTVTLGLGVIDTVDVLGVSTLQVSGLTLTPAVPEPGTWAMWLAGAGLLALSRRGRRAGHRGPGRAHRHIRSGSRPPAAARAVPR